MKSNKQKLSHTDLGKVALALVKLEKMLHVSIDGRESYKIERLMEEIDLLKRLLII